MDIFSIILAVVAVAVITYMGARSFQKSNKEQSIRTGGGGVSGGGIERDEEENEGEDRYFEGN